jgi:hypothetical protein
MCKTKIQKNIYYNEVNKCKHKNSSKEGYKTSSYFILMLNRLKVMGRSYIYLYPFGDLAQRSFMEVFMCPPTKEVFWKAF